MLKKLYYKFFHMFNVLTSWSSREKDFYTMMKFLRINKLEGDYAEFGVASGKTLILAYYIARMSKVSNGMKFYAFDSYKGLPEPKGTDKSFHWKKGDYNYSLKEVKNTLRRSGVNPKNIVFVEGFYDKTLKKKHGIKKLSAVHIDCDYYDSTVAVLEYIKDYLQTGTVILFDDWYCFNNDPDKGEQKALSEFLKKNKKIRLRELPTQGLGKMFSVLIKK